MTFEEACQLLGYDEPLEWMDDQSRQMLVAAVEALTENGTKPMEPADMLRLRREIGTFR